MTASSARTHMGSRALNCTTGSLPQCHSHSVKALFGPDKVIQTYMPAEGPIAQIICCRMLESNRQASTLPMQDECLSHALIVGIWS